MPFSLTYPGIYLEEIPSGVRTISGVSTAETGFADFFPRGPVGTAVRVTSFAEFTRIFGGLDARSEAGYAIQQYYGNGGNIAWVVRLDVGAPATAKGRLPASSPEASGVDVSAANPGTWGNNVRVAVVNSTQPDHFDLFVQETGGDRKTVLRDEVHRGLNLVPGSARYAPTVVNAASALLRIDGAPTGAPPAGVPAGTVSPPDSAYVFLGDAGEEGVPGTDGNAFNAQNEPISQLFVDAITGSATISGALAALERIDPFAVNIVCLPVTARLTQAAAKTVLDQAIAFCEAQRAFLVIDPPVNVGTPEQAIAWIEANGSLRHPNAAVYFPHLQTPDSLAEGRPRIVGPSGTMAGLFARTDVTRGVWKAPAGTEAVLRNAIPALTVTDAEQGGLNLLGINVFRTFPVIGPVCWGARTSDGADQRASEWKYIPPRRLALFIESSLVQGLKWAVFEPNDEPLWSQIRLNVGSFLNNLFVRGAFQGSAPREAYFVKCDAETTTQADIDRGVVNVVVGFAAVKPAEYVVIRIHQLTGQQA